MAKEGSTDIATRLRWLRPAHRADEPAPEPHEVSDEVPAEESSGASEAPADVAAAAADAEAVEAPQPQPSPQTPAQPQRLLGELSRASESLAEVLDALSAEKRQLEARTTRLEEELERSRKEAANARERAAVEVERARDETSAQLARATRMAAREHARAARAEQLLAQVGGLRESAAFCITVPRSKRRRASRELLAQAVNDGVQLNLTAHESWRDSLLLADVDGDPPALSRFLTWARGHFADADFRERQT